DYDPETSVVTTNSRVIYCKLEQTNPAPTSVIYLKADYVNKDGNATSPDPSVGWRLCMDGVRVHWKDDNALPKIDHPYTNDGALRLTISNLSAGVHTITTYHNDYYGKEPLVAWHAGNVLSRCIISVNGTAMYTNTPTFYSTNDSQCGFEFFNVTNSYD